MTGVKKVFLDTAPLIYFLDEDEHFGDKTRAILEALFSKGIPVVSSTITCMEYLVYPYRTHNQQKIDVFYEFVNECGIELMPIGSMIAAMAAEIRAKYRDFKAMDALQLAAAVCTGCDTFLTNDRQLRQYEDLNCITVEDWLLDS